MDISPLYEIDGTTLKRTVLRGGPRDGDIVPTDVDQTEVNIVTEWGNAGVWNKTFMLTHHYEESTAIESTNEGWAQVFHFVTTVREESSFEIPDVPPLEFKPLN